MQDSWTELTARLLSLRDSPTPLRLTLSRTATAVLGEYAQTSGDCRSAEGRWLRNAGMLAAKVALILQLWARERAREISADTMRIAIAQAGGLVSETAAVASSCLAAEEDSTNRQAAARMLEKLRRLGAVRPRELYRTYDDETTAIHQPILESLIGTKKVSSLADGRVVAVEHNGDITK